MNREAQMKKTEDHPNGEVRLGTWSVARKRHEKATTLKAHRFGYHHVPGQKGPKKSTYRCLRRTTVILYLEHRDNDLALTIEGENDMRR